jgi:hypothetical protein
LATGLVPLVAQAWGQAAWARVQPAAVLAFTVGFAVYSALARAGWEPPPLPLAEPAADPAPR